MSRMRKSKVPVKGNVLRTWDFDFAGRLMEFKGGIMVSRSIDPISREILKDIPKLLQTAYLQGRIDEEKDTRAHWDKFQEYLGI